MLLPQNVAVILLNYKGWQDTIACLRSLYSLKTLPGAIIVVDNASSDDSVQQIMAMWQQWASPILVRPASAEKNVKFAHALLLQLENNNGYASGNDAGIRLAKAFTSCTAYWILNNDTEPSPQSLDALCNRYNAAGEPALVGSTLVFHHDKETIQCTGGSRLIPFLGLTTPLYQGKKIVDIAGISTTETEKKLGDITGASLLIPEKIIQRIGLMREDFFLYLEDTEFSVRARKAGFPLLWAPDSIVLHKEGGTTGAASAGNAHFERPLWVDYLMLRNRVCFVREFYPWALPRLCFSYIIVACKRLLRKQSDRVCLVFRAMWHGIRRKMGKPDSLMAR